MKHVDDVPNVFIGENGEMIFIDSWELDDNECDDLNYCERFVERIEKKYGTDDIWKMIIDKKAPFKEIKNYIATRRKLMIYERY